MKNPASNEDLLCRYFVGVICESDRFSASRNIRQVLPWVGFVIGGLRFVDDLKIQRLRQITFSFSGKRFKAKFQHAGLKSGIRIVEVLPEPGSPEGETVFFIRSLKDAEHFYNYAADILRGKKIR